MSTLNLSQVLQNRFSPYTFIELRVLVGKSLISKDDETIHTINTVKHDGVILENNHFVSYEQLQDNFTIINN